MKKFLSVIFLAMIMLSITACGNFNSKPVPPSPKPSEETSSTTTEKKSDIIPDVPKGHFAYNSTKYVVENKILEPYGDGTFRGDKNITNYEFAMGLAKILDDTYKGTVEIRSMPFTDIPPQHWAYERVAKLAWAGVEEGYADGTFRGDKSATRYETAHSAGKLLKLVAPNKAKSVKRGMPFPDVPKNHWAYNSVSLLAMAGVAEGYGDGTFRGDRPRTRYEAAQMLAKLHSVLRKVNG